MRALRAGDRVRIVAPAGPVPADLLASGMTVLRDWGLDVSVAPHVLDTHPSLPYLAGADTDRAADLLQAWCDPQVDAVFCARGGYGCTRLLDLLDWPALAAADPKPLVGFSDITALHHAFTTRLGVPTVLGPTVTCDAFTDPASQDHLYRCLFHPDEPVVLTGAGPLVPGTGGVAHGTTAGGTATLLAALAGVAKPPDAAILLLEDVHETAYRLDRMLTQLRQAGWLDHVTGIALGSWTDCGPPELLRDMFFDRLAGLGVPVAWDLPFGHRTPQVSVRLGVPAELDADTGRLTVS